MKRAVQWLLILSLGCLPYQIPPSSPRVLKTWWMIVEACAHRTADFDAWTIAVSHDSLIELPGWPSVIQAYGATFYGMHMIVLSSIGAACPKIVRHEMLHAIDPRYDATHPDSIYQHCAGLVTPPVTDARDC